MKTIKNGIEFISAYTTIENKFKLKNGHCKRLNSSVPIVQSSEIIPTYFNLDKIYDTEEEMHSEFIQAIENYILDNKY